MYFVLFNSIHFIKAFHGDSLVEFNLFVIHFHQCSIKEAKALGDQDINRYKDRWIDRLMTGKKNLTFCNCGVL